MTPAQEARAVADELKINIQGQAAAEIAERAESEPSPTPENIRRIADVCDILFGVYPGADGNPAIGIIKGHRFLIAMQDDQTEQPKWNAIPCESRERLEAVRDMLERALH